MSNRNIRLYLGIDEKIVWDAARIELVELEARIVRLKSEMA